MSMIKHLAVVGAAGFTFWNPWTPNFYDWATAGPENAGIKVAIGGAYAVTAFVYGWIVARVEVFPSHRKLPHTLIWVSLAALWLPAIWLMIENILPMTDGVFYGLLLASVAIALAVEAKMHDEARRGPGADKVKAKIARAHQHQGTVR